MIELPEDEIDEYHCKMAELKWVNPPKDETVELKKEATSAPEVKKGEEKKKVQPILKVVFKLNLKKTLKERIRDFDEDEPKNLLKFDLNFWDINKIREFEDSVDLIEIAPF
jgi:hypothetical protein